MSTVKTDQTKVDLLTSAFGKLFDGKEEESDAVIGPWVNMQGSWSVSFMPGHIEA